MKHLIKITRSCIRMLLVLAACCLTAAFPVKAETEPLSLSSAEDAEAFIRILFSEDASSLDGKYLMSGLMEKAVSSAGGFQALAQTLTAQLGTPESIGSAYEEKTLFGTSFRVPCIFSSVSLDLVVSMDKGAISGLVTSGYTGDKKETAPEDTEGFDSLELSIPVPSLNGELPGTLTIPKGDGPFPVVILVHGSGPNDRDETLMSLTPFKDLAEGLAKHGIAVYRYDKRTYVYGAQLASEKQATLHEETIDDAVEAVRLMAEQDRIDPSRIFVLGHSLGAMAVPAIAQSLQESSVKPCGYILMAAGARRLDLIMREQYEFLYSLMPEVTQEQLDEKDRILSELDKLNDPDVLTEDDMIAGAYSAYWKWLLDYDILGTAKEITVPCLLLQGEEDYQVSMEDFALWKEAVGSLENWTLISYPGLTHLFITGQKSQGSAAYTKDERMSPQVIDDIAAFVLS